MRQTILRLLADGDWHSGEELAQALSVSRTTIWKQISTLRIEGFIIDAGGKRGYRLQIPPDALHPALWAGAEQESILYFRTVDSTNRVIKELAAQGAPEGMLVIAEEQTAGRGRRGRGWIAPSGSSLLFSLLLRPAISPAHVQGLVLAMALAMAESCETLCQMPVGIKWPNDLIMEGRKICGMLLELAATESEVEWVALGAGVNVHQQRSDFPEEIREQAGSLWTQSGKHIARAALCQLFRARMMIYTAQYAKDGWEGISDAYARHSVTLGKMVRVICTTDTFVGMAESIDNEGALWIRLDTGMKRRVFAGDVSVRGVMGYV